MARPKIALIGAGQIGGTLAHLVGKLVSDHAYSAIAPRLYWQMASWKCAPG